MKIKEKYAQDSIARRAGSRMGDGTYTDMNVSRTL